MQRQPKFRVLILVMAILITVLYVLVHSSEKTAPSPARAVEWRWVGN